MRTAREIRLDIKWTSHDLLALAEQQKALRRRLGAALAEARDHPEMTLEEGRRTAEREIPRQTAVRLVAEAAEQD